jgi:hypothetical protein
MLMVILSRSSPKAQARRGSREDVFQCEKAGNLDIWEVFPEDFIKCLKGKPLRFRLHEELSGFSRYLDVFVLKEQ